MARYVPPVQGKVSQLIDVIVLLILSIGALYLPLWMHMAGSTKTPVAVTDPTWESLGQNAAMVAQYNKLGYADAASAADLITARFDYSFSGVQLAVMIVVIVGYFVLMLRFSETEYKEVIAEKFDGK